MYYLCVAFYINQVMDTQILKLEAPYEYIFCNGVVALHIATLIVYETSEDEEGEYQLEAHSHPIVHHQVTSSDVQRSVCRKIEVVAHLEIALCTRGDGESRNFHIILCGEVYGNLHLDKVLLSVDSGSILSVEYKLMNQTLTTDFNAASMVIVTGSEE